MKFKRAKIVLITANNNISYGSGFKITPQARNDDGLLNICLVDELSAWKVIPRLPFVIIGKRAPRLPGLLTGKELKWNIKDHHRVKED
ncbi:hypothetical protein [Candidatus Oleimmundimicrobium sp.]|uniref:hypothetical protein n=1 Tax=Candidatus Oleimmundimicrobium sp. TaxID=3060597 RepID=UPI00271B5E98|nr:hypothetical protein [Candidatus Oleimmundimicrobium sp.]MDO8885683.1 hypothetical protein [Candidatus Oleimmundimicrobium sp.]